MKAKLYVEGAGQSDYERTQCRRSFGAFFAAAGLLGKRPAVVPCGGRTSAFSAFETAVAGNTANERPLLLVDSEAPLNAGRTPAEHLKQRDDWDKPAAVADDQIHLMVQLMETWFVADRELLEKYFGQMYIARHLAAWPALEAVPKATILSALGAATARCPKQYAKGARSFDILAQIDPSKVEAACPYARRLLQYLRAL